MLPDLNRLQVFYHVYQLTSINAAARELHLTQPAVSQQIKKLESEVNAPLFTRLHKKIVPTAAGNRLFLMVEPFIRELASNIQYISKPLNQPYGRLDVGAPLEFGKSYLPQICRSFREKYPEVRFRFKLDEPDVLLSMVKDGRLDFALVDYFSARDQFLDSQDLFRIEPVSEETWILACSAGYYDDCIKADHSFENIQRQSYLTDEHEPVILRHWFWHHYGKVPADVDIVLAIDSHQALLSCVRLGMGLAVTARHLVDRQIRSGKLVTVGVKPADIVSKLSLVQLAGKTPTLTESVFQDFLKQKIS